MNISILGDKCVGCTSCQESCPRGAITLYKNEQDEACVRVEKSKCVECGRCMNVCPALVDNLYCHKSIDAYCISFDDEISKYSSSGGAFFVLALQAFKLGWYVCGAVYSEDFLSVKHIVASSEDDIKKMRGSKYIESDLNTIWKKLDSIISLDDAVILFSGTPCQCAAVQKRYVKQLHKIYLIELICNGTMAPIILQKQIQQYSHDMNSKVIDYTMRFKKESYLPLYEKVVFSNGKEQVEQFYSTNLGAIYGSRIILRECCYKCQYKGSDRIGDITLGDYRGFAVEKNSTQSQYGMSTLIVNSEMGAKLLDIIRPYATIDNAKSMKDVYAGNNRLLIYGFSPSKKNRRMFRLNTKDTDIEGLKKQITKYYKRPYIIKRKLIEAYQLKGALHRNEF